LEQCALLFAERASLPMARKGLTMSTQENPFTGPQLQNAEYAKADMSGSHFNGVNLAKSTFYAVLTEAEFRDTNLSGAKFDDVNLSNAQFNNINLSGGSFGFLNLSDTAITDATMTDAAFRDTNLSGARFNDVDLSKAHIRDTDFSGGSFSDLNLSNTAITDSKLDGMTIDGILVTELFAAYEASKAVG